MGKRQSGLWRYGGTGDVPFGSADTAKLHDIQYQRNCEWESAKADFGGTAVLAMSPSAVQLLRSCTTFSTSVIANGKAPK
ncbi:MAG: hypothetical protein K9J46_23710, partial [Saprospiraceae bacterium]|nr:hypothetical protein [Saprospiraceae bacterium]